MGLLSNRMFVTALSTLAVCLGCLAGGRPAQASYEDCPAFGRAVAISVRKGNGVYPNAYRGYIDRGFSTSRAKSTASGDANNAFWRSLIVQSAAIVDYSTDAAIFIDLFMIANGSTQDEVGRAFGRAMRTCSLKMDGEWPKQRVFAL